MNNFGQHLRNYEYKTKYHDVFTWNQNLIHLNRISVPEFQKPQEPDGFAKAYEKAINELKELRQLSDYFNPTNITDLYDIPPHIIDLLGLKKIDNTVNIESRTHNKDPKNIINQPPPSKKKEQVLKKLERLEKKYQKKSLNAIARNNLESQNKLRKDSDIKPVKLADYNFLSIHKPRKSFFDEEEDLHSEKDKHKNGEFFLDKKDRKNMLLNRVLSHVNINERELDKNDIKNETNKKIDKVIGQIKLHKDIIISILFVII